MRNPSSGVSQSRPAISSQVDDGDLSKTHEGESTTEFWAPFRKTSSRLINEQGREVNLAASIDTPSAFVYDDDLESWLTYRRNFLSFEVSTNLADPTLLSSLRTPESAVPISYLKAALQASTITTKTNVELLQFDTLRSLARAAPVAPQRLAPVRLGTKKSKVTSSASTSTAATTFSTNFTRIQFRASTSNHPNASPEASNNYFVLEVTLSAVHEDGGETKLGTWESAKLVVRGRSPVNFERSKRKKEGQAVAPSKKKKSLSRPQVREAEDAEEGDEGSPSTILATPSDTSSYSTESSLATPLRRSKRLSAPAT
ncbi:hypothetical protein JCM16303_005141 [Sporobolomyces ruberrimus]